MSTALRFSASSSPPPPATDPITHPLGSPPTVDVPERHMIVGHSCHISHGCSPEVVSTYSLYETFYPDYTADVPWPATY